MTLKEKVLDSFLWIASENITRMGLNFIVGVILARLLEPAEFGLIGMLAVFISLSNLFIDSGFSQSLIRKKNCRSEDYSTVFIFNIIVSGVCYIILFFSAAYISRFYQQPLLIYITRVYAIVLILQSFALIQQTILIKNLDFNFLAKVNVASSFVASIAAIFMAYRGFGVWSLVCQQLFRQIFINILLWTKQKWKMHFRFEYSLFMEHFNFGIKMLLSGLIYSISHNIYYLVIGKVFSARELGFYTRAEQFRNLPSQNFTTIISKVSYPVLSKLQDSQQQLLNGYRNLIQHSTYIVFISMIGLAAMSRNIILVMIGEKWLPSGDYLVIMCFAAMLFPLHALNLNILKVKGRSDLFLKLEIIKQFLIIPTIILGVFFGIKIMLCIMVFNSYFGYYLNSYYSGRLINYSIIKQVKDIFPNYVLAFEIGFFTHLSKSIFSQNIYFGLLIQLITFFISIIFLSIITKNESFFYILDILKGYGSKILGRKMY